MPWITPGLDVFLHLLLVVGILAAAIGVAYLAIRGIVVLRLRTATLSEDELEEYADALFDFFAQRVTASAEWVNIDQGFVDLGNPNSVDRWRIATKLIERRLVRSAITKDSEPGFIDAITFTPPRYLQATEIGWDDIMEERRRVMRPPQPPSVTQGPGSVFYNITGNAGHVRIKTGKIDMDNTGAAMVDALFAALLDALRQDSESLESAYQKNEVALLIRDIEVSAANKPKAEKRLLSAAKKVSNFLPNIAAAMKGTNDVLAQINQLIT